MGANAVLKALPLPYWLSQVFESPSGRVCNGSAFTSAVRAGQIVLVAAYRHARDSVMGAPSQRFVLGTDTVHRIV